MKSNRSKIMIVFCTIFFIFNSKAQFKYIEPPIDMIKVLDIIVDTIEYKDVTRYLPKDYKKDGSVDYTEYLQKAIEENERILLPNFPLLINDKGLHLYDNSKIYFQKGTSILLSPSKRSKYAIINLEGVNNVSIYSPKLIGDRLDHIGESGEWGMGINIRSSSNIQIYNANIKNCWGDGIYLGSIDGKTPNFNISISGGVIDNNRRNGISIISASNVTIKDILLSNSNGTLPMAGIDIEPNYNLEELHNVRLDNIITYNNEDVGFLIYLGSMLGSDRKDVQINLLNCKDYYSKASISIPGLRNDYDDTIKKINGEIIIDNFSSYHSHILFRKSSGNYVYTPQIKVSNVNFIPENK